VIFYDYLSSTRLIIVYSCVNLQCSIPFQRPGKCLSECELQTAYTNVSDPLYGVCVFIPRIYTAYGEVFVIRRHYL